MIAIINLGSEKHYVDQCLCNAQGWLTRAYGMCQSLARIHDRLTWTEEEHDLFAERLQIIRIALARNFRWHRRCKQLVNKTFDRSWKTTMIPISKRMYSSFACVTVSTAARSALIRCTTAFSSAKSVWSWTNARLANLDSMWSATATAPTASKVTLKIMNRFYIVPGHKKRDCFDFCKSSPFTKWWINYYLNTKHNALQNTN